ncbi:MAG: hypothetical protein GQ574_13170 [Crocinitomix sp.]|nr:hypothetical protein [Crocinitomix sp.]
MIGTTLNSALLSLNQNLNHPGLLIDARTEQQYLNFIAGFSRLINFYNKENNKDGSWEPFLLKDPVFLLATISQTDVTYKSNLFKNSCTHCLSNLDPNDTNNVSSLNPLFNQVFGIFDDLLKWSEYMCKCELTYPLKNDIIGEIEVMFATCFWAFVDLLNELSLSNTFTGLINTDQGFTYKYETNLWASVNNRKPYQKVLGLTAELADTSLTDLVNCFIDTGTKVFQFYKHIVKRSNSEYQNISTQKTAYPDTLLLRTFFELLKVNQQDLNGLTQKHLTFYYDRVLKQLNRKAKADAVYICADLAKTDTAFLLSKGTAFNAGVSATKENIVFEADKNYFLNPAKILNAHTLLIHESSPTKKQTYDITKGPYALEKILPTVSILINQNKAVDTLKKDENGALLTWDTFGAPGLATNTTANLGVAFASPMLLLKEGTRTIDLVFTFEQPTQASILTKATFYLSTKSAWLPLKGKQIIEHLPQGLIGTLHLTFKLSAIDPPIEKFEKNPDGYTESWPLIKIVYHAINDITTPPMIKCLDITTSVENLKSLVASNDNGALVTAKPFMPFGPIVQRDSSLYLGNAEIFSKPLEFLSFNISWDKLPPNFAVYYKLYNAYLMNDLAAPKPKETEAEKKKRTGKKTLRSRIAGWFFKLWNLVTKSNPIVTGITTAAKWVFKWVKKIIGKVEEEREEKKEEEAKKDEPETKVELGVFNNASFKVAFELLSNHKWSAISIDRELESTFTDGVFECVPPNFKDETTSDGIVLFNQNKDKGTTLNKKISFVYKKPEDLCPPIGHGNLRPEPTHAASDDASATETSMPYNPSLQNAEMLYSEKTAGGFMRMSLLAPLQGFGFDIYPQVISQVTLENAVNLINAAKEPSEAEVKAEADAKAAAAKVAADEAKAKEDAAAAAAATAASAAATAAAIAAALAATATTIEKATAGSIKSAVTPKEANAVDSNANPKSKSGESSTSDGDKTPSGTLPVAPIKSSGPLPLPNPPFAPMISSITASYQAKISHTFHYQQETDPIQCYHYSVFNNYLVYDSTRDCSAYKKNIGVELCGPNVLRPYLPMFASVAYNAVLYLEMENVIVGKEVSLFIELNQSANPNGDDQVSIDYFYLSDSTWKPLELIYDGSKGLKCSGILTFEFPADMDTTNLQMNSSNFWIALGLNGNADLIGKTSFLKTNGLKLERAGMDYLNDTISPALEAGKITATLAPIPEIKALIQPFSSFGGKAAENKPQKNSRVANLLKTKGRPITINDFNRFVMQDFTSIFYSKVNYDKASRTVSIRLVKKIDNEFASNAFLPMVSACEELEVETAIKAQAEIENLKVKNFEIEYVTVNATVYIQPEFDIKGASNRITQALKVFLSPWIDTSQKQVTIDQGVTDAQVASFITGFQEVSGIEDVSFQLAQYDNGKKGHKSKEQNNVKPTDLGTLLVPNVKHGIKWEKAG